MITAVIDTHALIWYLYDDARLSNTARQFMEITADSQDQIALSSITLIEMVYLIEKGRVASESLSIMAGELDDPSGLFIEVPVDLQIARTLTRIDGHQIPDMPDRIIAATAIQRNVPVISRDGKIRISNVQTIW
ncbi:MAG: type II toxin-antitoxin system VapC family toxin [Anaerolineaceae bacterium]|nr:type II toxin-antitoxin system VapC family toxin [Anaerolineaceae bacterium]